MNEIVKLTIASIAGALIALLGSYVLSKESVNQTRLAEYSACLNFSGDNYARWVESDDGSRPTNVDSDWNSPLNVCNYLKP